MTGAGDALPLAWQPAAPEDAKNNIDAEHRDELARLLVALKHRPRMGEWLRIDDRTGDLSDRRKIKFGPDHGRGPIYRLVYRLLPDNYEPAKVEIVAIGRKEDLVAYVLAATRLDRI